MRRRSSRIPPLPRSPKRRLGMVLVVTLFAIASYYVGARRDFNPVTEEPQRGSMTVDQEVALGLQAALQMAQQHGGLNSDQQAQAALDRIGEHLVAQSGAGRTPYRFEFHLLADKRTVNAFALPGGQVFMTSGLVSRLRTEGEVAGVLAHEIGHVVGRHAVVQMDRTQRTQGLADAASIDAFDPNDPSSAGYSQIAALIGQAVDMKYGRDDELEADSLGVQFMAEAGYDPRALIGVMEVLEAAARSNRHPEFFSTHPNPDRRIEQIQRAIEDAFPNGVPEGLVK